MPPAAAVMVTQPPQSTRSSPAAEEVKIQKKEACSIRLVREKTRTSSVVVPISILQFQDVLDHRMGGVHILSAIKIFCDLARGCARVLSNRFSGFLSVHAIFELGDVEAQFEVLCWITSPAMCFISFFVTNVFYVVFFILFYFFLFNIPSGFISV